MRDGVFKLFATNHSPQLGRPSAFAICCAACRTSTSPPELGYDNLFRVIIMQFIDAYSFDVRSVKKTCVHIVHPDGAAHPVRHLQPVLPRRSGATRLVPLRAGVELGLEGRTS